MTDTAITAPSNPAPRTRTEKPRITRKVRRAIHDMVWEAMPVAQAAAKHGMQGAAFSRALSRPSVQALLKQEVDVLRASARPEAVNRIVGLMRSSQLDRIKLDAAKHIDIGDKQSGVTVNVGVGVKVEQTPGYVVDVSGYVQDVEQIQRLSRDARKPLSGKGNVPTDA